MIAAVTLVVVYALGAVLYLAFAVHALAHGTPATALVAGVFGAYFAVPFVAVVWWFALAWIYRSPRPPDKRIGVAATIRLFTDEVWSVAGSPIRMGILWWRMREPASAPAAAPVLLVHGVGCNSGVWLRFLAYLRPRGIGPLYTISYEPPLASLEVVAAQLSAKIDAIIGSTGAGRVILVCHSMGGLVARAYLRRFGTGKVRAVIAIGTPHRGSIHARAFPGACLAEMRPGSSWLEALNREGLPQGVRCAALWSWHDSMVAPQLSARWDSAESVDFVGIGHNALLGHVGVFAKVAELVAQVQADAAAEPPRR